MTIREPLDVDAVEAEWDGVASHVTQHWDCCGGHEIAHRVRALIAEVRALRAENDDLRRDLAANEGSEAGRLVVEAARRAVYPGGVNEFNGLVAAVSRLNAESPKLPAQEVPW